MNKKTAGFTIVELLIVIVVIAILSAISIVAYSGIANSANDAVVKNDLANMAEKIRMIYAETGSYPAGGQVVNSEGVSTGSGRTFPGFTFTASKRAYSDLVNNLSYCTGEDTETGQSAFRILAQSKSLRNFEYTSMNGLVDKGKGWIPIYEHIGLLCDGISRPRSTAAGYNTDGSWSGWVR